MEKFEINVEFENDSAKFNLNKSSNLEKLFKIIELYYEKLNGKEFGLIFNDKNLRDFNYQVKLCDIFTQKTYTYNSNSNENFDVINIIVDYNQENIEYLRFECGYRSMIKSFKMLKDFTLHKLKFKILTFFEELEQEMYQIMYKGRDIQNKYADDKILSEIFKCNELIRLTINIKPKNIVEIHKRCSICTENKAISICNKCAVYLCETCMKRDPHDSNSSECFVKLTNFKEFEQSTLENLLQTLKSKETENQNLNSKNFQTLTREKINLIDNKFKEMIENLQTLKNTQINNFNLLVDLIKNKYKPESINEVIESAYQTVDKYKNKTYYDSEESMRKIIELEEMVNKFCIDFNNCSLNIEELNSKFTQNLKICNTLNTQIKSSITQAKGIFKNMELETAEKSNYNLLMKVLDSNSILVYDHNKEVFSQMNFNDHNKVFNNNFNNYVQLNYTRNNLLFIVTGSPCQKLFCYNYNTNEMEYINTLKFNHNWWPTLIITNNDTGVNKINLFCLSGTYTTNCEKLVMENKTTFSNEKDLNFEWVQIPSLNVAHGQATSFVQNDMTIYVLFGYDFNYTSIATVERLSPGSESWELVTFDNPHAISSILYYHASLKINEQVLILGGLKEIGESDVVYEFDYSNSSLLKTEYFFDLKNYNFSVEKGFTQLDMVLEESMPVDFKTNAKMFDSLDVKDFNETLKLKKEKKAEIYALFDSKNNVHLINSEKFTHKIKFFEKLN